MLGLGTSKVEVRVVGVVLAVVVGIGGVICGIVLGKEEVAVCNLWLVMLRMTLCKMLFLYTA